MNRPALAELLRAFDAAGGCVELQDGDLKLTAMHGTSRDLADELRAARFDLVDLLDGTARCTFCGRSIDRHSAKLPSTGCCKKGPNPRTFPTWARHSRRCRAARSGRAHRRPGGDEVFTRSAQQA